MNYPRLGQAVVIFFKYHIGLVFQILGRLAKNAVVGPAILAAKSWHHHPRYMGIYDPKPDPSEAQHHLKL